MFAEHTNNTTELVLPFLKPSAATGRFRFGWWFLLQHTEAGVTSRK